MAVAPLDNSVIFKKLFTDPEILTVFVKDLTGLDIEPEIIETDKRFSSPNDPIEVEFDVFVEDPKHRLIVQIKKAPPDSHYDLFFYYHQFAGKVIKSNPHYYEWAIHTIVWAMERVQDEAERHSLVTTRLRSVTSGGEEVPLYPHKLYFLNPYYVNIHTPLDLSDWLWLAVESILNSDRPNLNYDRAIFYKVIKLISDEEHHLA
jgi:hypothetical protein